MINKGADVNMNNYVDRTALMLAAENGNLEEVKLPINAGADVNKRIRCGDSPLLLAAEKKSCGMHLCLSTRGSQCEWMSV